MILELIGAEPVRRMIERIDCGARADRAKGADSRPRDKAILVHAEILAGNHIRTDLGIPVEEQWTADRRFDDAGTRIEFHDAVKKCRLAAGVLEKVDEQFRIFHVALRMATVGRANAAAIPDRVTGKELSGRLVRGKLTAHLWPS